MVFGPFLRTSPPHLCQVSGNSEIDSQHVLLITHTYIHVYKEDIKVNTAAATIGKNN